jgi:hypothetical protein
MVEQCGGRAAAETKQQIREENQTKSPVTMAPGRERDSNHGDGYGRVKRKRESSELWM